MGKFNWGRRSKKRPPLSRKEAFKGKSFLLQQIEHGDFDYSDYHRQALHEKELCVLEQRKVTKSWIAGPDSLKERLEEIERKYIKRYNKLMEDHHKEETKLLHTLREKLILEFGMNVWDEVLTSDWEQDLVKFYYNYKRTALNIKHKNESARSKETPAN